MHLGNIKKRMNENDSFQTAIKTYNRTATKTLKQPEIPPWCVCYTRFFYKQPSC